MENLTVGRQDKLQTLILCAGSAARWKWRDYLNVPKQLVPVPDEPLLERTVRLLKCRGYGDPIVVTHLDTLKSSNYSCFYPENRRWTVETLRSTMGLWANRTFVILGDVYYSEQALDRMIQEVSGIKFFGRKHRDVERGEIFALFFDRGSQPLVVDKLEKAIALAQSSKTYNNLWRPLKRLIHMLMGAKATRKNIVWNTFWDTYQGVLNLHIPQPYIWGRLWSLYYLLYSSDMSDEALRFDNFIEFNDDTMDFDSPEDYDLWKRRFVG